jgi:UTP-glucose-1-phosphate uridylyltransferase
LCAKPVVGNEPFAIILADDLIRNDDKGVVQQMAEVYERTGASVLSVQEVPPEETDKYGIVETETSPTAHCAWYRSSRSRSRRMHRPTSPWSAVTC